MDSNFLKDKKLRTLILVILFVLLFFWKTDTTLSILTGIFSIVSPFLLAGAIAFVLNIPMNWFEKKLFFSNGTKKTVSHTLARSISLVLSILFFIALFTLAVFVLVPQIIDTINTLRIQLEIFLPEAQSYVTSIFKNNPEIVSFINELDFTEIKNSVIDFLRAGVLNIFDSTITIASSLVSFGAKIFIAIVFSFYMLLQKEVLANQFKKLFFAYWRETTAHRIVSICSMIQNAFTRFITGQCFEAIILGTLIVIILSIFRIPFSLLIGVVVGFSSIIPILGAFAGAGISAFLLLVEDPIQSIYFLIIFVIVQQIEGNLIYPKVVGDSIGLPAMWVLAAVSIGGTIMGVVGILLFIPLASVAYALLREDVHKRLNKE